MPGYRDQVSGSADVRKAVADSGGLCNGGWRGVDVADEDLVACGMIACVQSQSELFRRMSQQAVPVRTFDGAWAPWASDLLAGSSVEHSVVDEYTDDSVVHVGSKRTVAWP